MAVTVEYGKCEQCGDNNVKTAELCRSCKMPLPWSKAVKAQSKAAATGQSSSPMKASIKLPGSDLSTGFWVQILGGAIFCSAIAYYVACFAGAMTFVRGPGYAAMVIGGMIWGAGAAMD